MWKYAHNRHFKIRALFLFSLSAFYYGIVTRNTINLLKAFLVLKQLTLKHKILTSSGTVLDLAAVFRMIYMNCGALWKALRCLRMWLVCMWFTVTSFLSTGRLLETSLKHPLLHLSSTTYGSIISDLNFLPCYFSN